MEDDERDEYAASFGIKSVEEKDAEEEERSEFFHRRKKETRFSLFHVESELSRLSETLRKQALAHQQARKDTAPNLMNLDAKERRRMVALIISQVEELGATLKEEITSEKGLLPRIGYKEEIIGYEDIYYPRDAWDRAYCSKPFVQWGWKIETQEEKPKLVVLLSDPSLSQIDSQNIDPNALFSNHLEQVAEMAQALDKNCVFLFAIPFFLGSSKKEEPNKKQKQEYQEYDAPTHHSAPSEKERILENASIFKPFVRYLRDMLLVMNPACILAIGKPALEFCVNNFEDNAREYIFAKTPAFNSKVSSFAKGESFAVIQKLRRIRIFTCPHPFALKMAKQRFEKAREEKKEVEEQQKRQGDQNEFFEQEDGGQPPPLIAEETRCIDEQKWDATWKMLTAIFTTKTIVDAKLELHKASMPKAQPTIKKKKDAVRSKPHFNPKKQHTLNNFFVKK
jgi:hypothetical protein